MLPSQELRQQQHEAAQIAEEGKQRRRAEPKASATTTEHKHEWDKKRACACGQIDARAPDLAGGIDVDGLRYPANVMMANSQSAFAVGNHYSNSMSISGVVERIVLMPGGYCYGSVLCATGLRWVAVLPSGMTAELSP